MEKFKNWKQSAQQEKAQTEVELFHAKKAVKDLVFKIEQHNAQAHARKQELQSIRSAPNGGEDPHHAELRQQLDCLKQELGKLKLDVSSVLESKAKAEKDIEVYGQKRSSSLLKVEKLRKEIEEANEEHVLVELARIEAEKELREIESKQAAEAMEFSKKMEAAKKRISEIRKEIGKVKELEEKLAATNADISVLQDEMELVRAMTKKFDREIWGVKEKEKNNNIDEEQLRMAEDELSKAKKELERIKDEGFQLMASMDLAREELLSVSKETSRLEKQEKNYESSIERLNSKLSKAKLKLEFSASEQKRAMEIITSLRTALQKLQTEVVTAKEEKDKASKETCDIKKEVDSIKLGIKFKERELQDAITELGEVKASEAAALVKLKAMMEETVKSRAMASQNSTMISLSSWEHSYLIKKGELSQAMADKKIAAINGWIDVLRAQEKEMLLKRELVEKEIKEIRTEEEEKVCHEEGKAVVVRKMMEDEADEFLDMLNNGISMTASRRRPKVTRASTMAGAKSATRSLSFPITKRKGMKPNFGGTILRGRRRSSNAG